MHGQEKFKALATRKGFRSLPYPLDSIVGLAVAPFQVLLKAYGNPGGWPSQAVCNTTQQHWPRMFSRPLEMNATYSNGSMHKCDVDCRALTAEFPYVSYCRNFASDWLTNTKESDRLRGLKLADHSKFTDLPAR